MAARSAVMDRGRIVYDGASETLRNNLAKLEQLIGVVKALRQWGIAHRCVALVARA